MTDVLRSTEDGDVVEAIARYCMKSRERED